MLSFSGVRSCVRISSSGTCLLCAVAGWMLLLAVACSIRFVHCFLLRHVGRDTITHSAAVTSCRAGDQLDKSAVAHTTAVGACKTVDQLDKSGGAERRRSSRRLQDRRPIGQERLSTATYTAAVSACKTGGEALGYVCSPSREEEAETEAGHGVGHGVCHTVAAATAAVTPAATAAAAVSRWLGLRSRCLRSVILGLHDRL